ncbi:hypothetical protein [Laspinema olomoucense]|uniref:Uncharacterized protein n=1 Tax=Laspinema olomoucense D3b TaxID=2953688 RepID=A0ABT2NFX6_9CYAN|nr:hypothetical protein [Laspinema sp. D3b]MCT7981452.1 hypothetical protein [Laspinema sp. D3b]
MNSYPTPTENNDAQTQAQIQQAQTQLQQALAAIQRASNGASVRLQGAPDAMKSGAGTAIDTINNAVGNTLKHSNPKHPWRSLAYWSMSIGLFVIVTSLFSACQGAISGVASNEPLPYNAPVAARTGNATVRGLKLVTQLGSPLVEESDRTFRTQLIRQQGGPVPNNGPIPVDRSRIMNVRTNVEQYQSR